MAPPLPVCVAADRPSPASPLSPVRRRREEPPQWRTRPPQVATGENSKFVSHDRKLEPIRSQRFCPRVMMSSSRSDEDSERPSGPSQSSAPPSRDQRGKEPTTKQPAGGAGEEEEHEEEEEGEEEEEEDSGK